MCKFREIWPTGSRWNRALLKGKGKGFPYSIPSVGQGADPGVQAVSPQVTVSHPPGGRLPFPPGLRLPPKPQGITALWPVPSYTAWWQRHIGVNNLPKVVTQRHLEQDLNLRPVDRKSKRLTRCTTVAYLTKKNFACVLPLSLLRGSRPKSARASPRHCTQSAPDFIQIGLLSAELACYKLTTPRRRRYYCSVNHIGSVDN